MKFLSDGRVICNKLIESPVIPADTIYFPFRGSDGDQKDHVPNENTDDVFYGDEGFMYTGHSLENLYNGTTTNANTTYYSHADEDGWKKIELILALDANRNACRMYVDLVDLTDGEYYSCSYEVYNPMDYDVEMMINWCGIGNDLHTIPAKTIKRIHIIETRSTYDSTYRFLDFALTTNDSVGDQMWVRNPQIIHEDDCPDHDSEFPYIGGSGIVTDAGMHTEYPNDLMDFTSTTWTMFGFFKNFWDGDVDGTNYYRGVVACNNGLGTGRVLIGFGLVGTDNHRFRVYIGGTTEDNTLYFDLTSSRGNFWQFFCLRRNGTELKLWHGSEKDSLQTDTSSNGNYCNDIDLGTKNILFGSWSDTLVIDGYIRDFGLIPYRALSDTEVEKIYNVKLRDGGHYLNVNNFVQEEVL